MDSLPPQFHGCKPDDAPSRCSAPALLNVMLRLDAEGHARIVLASTDSADCVESCRRLHTWLRSEAVALLLEDIRGGSGL